MYIISTHFEGVECQLKLLFLTPTNYTIVYIQVEIHAKEIRTTTEVLTIKPLELQNPLKKCLTCAQADESNFYFVLQEQPIRTEGEIIRGTKKRGPDVYSHNISFLHFTLKEGRTASDDVQGMEMLWSSATIKTKNVRAKIGKETLGVMDLDRSILYIYSLHEKRYRGFIDLHRIAGMDQSPVQNPENSTSDFIFCKNHAKGSFMVFFQDVIYLFSQMNAKSLDSYMPEEWTCIHKFSNVLNLT